MAKRRARTDKLTELAEVNRKLCEQVAQLLAAQQERVRPAEDPAVTAARAERQREFEAEEQRRREAYEQANAERMEQLRIASLAAERVAAQAHSLAMMRTAKEKVAALPTAHDLKIDEYREPAHKINAAYRFGQTLALTPHEMREQAQCDALNRQLHN